MKLTLYVPGHVSAQGCSPHVLIHPTLMDSHVPHLHPVTL